ncbi:hypothetical protein DPMN_047428 [Dreissena polymorpha]|uniref:Uncharacterized protein n=1 Tax=Dreissena polymorpha TaxID=45954 RepID=A0A9D4DBF2_DREPO|nr:hypothetical protein DPMN_047428 [Dreissena polymorpha]
MWDLWYRIKESAWPRVQKTPPTDEICTCLDSVEFNGIKVKGDVLMHGVFF